jgi:hypothetical protein
VWQIYTLCNKIFQATTVLSGENVKGCDTDV